MPERPRLTARQAEQLLIGAGFALIRTRGSHRLYRRGDRRITVPFHGGRTLHPKVVAQVLRMIE